MWKLKALFNFAKTISYGKNATIFKKFDYGSSNENLKNYGSLEPPSYDLSLISNKVILISGTKDQFSSSIDVQNLFEITNDNVKIEWIDNWNHMTFLSPKNPEILNKIIEKYLM